MADPLVELWDREIRSAQERALVGVSDALWDLQATLRRRARYGGRKGRRAAQRITEERRRVLKAMCRWWR